MLKCWKGSKLLAKPSNDSDISTQSAQLSQLSLYARS